MYGEFPKTVCICQVGLEIDSTSAKTNHDINEQNKTKKGPKIHAIFYKGGKQKTNTLEIKQNHSINKKF